MTTAKLKSKNPTRPTVKIDIEQHRRLKIYCAGHRGVTIEGVVDSLIRAFLQGKSIDK
jgi:hypothetical protein